MIEGDASFIAEDSISLGENGLFRADTLSLSGLAIEVTETNDTFLTNVDAESLDMFSGGDIESEQDAVVSILDRARFNADEGSGDIDLSVSNNTFGSLHLTGVSIDVSETDDTVLDFVQADNLLIDSLGSISDSSGRPFQNSSTP